MKIGIPCDSQKTSDPVCVSFGRAPFFLIYDTENKTKTFHENMAKDAQGGAGIKAAQSLADLGAEAIITFRCGQNAAEVLQAADIKLFKATEASVAENIAELVNGNLVPLTDIHPGYHGQK